jgi:pimeloyl-ACP methyl ester carboxylesterase
MLGPHVPTLYYSCEAAEARGARVVSMHWPDHPQPVALGEGTADRVVALVGAALDEQLPDSRRPVLFAKSLGTLASPVARQRALPAVWFTPILTDDVGLDPRAFADAVEQTAAPCLIVGGSSDPLWDEPRARSLSPYVVEVPGADHGLHRPGSVTETIAVMGDVIAAVEAFLDETVWPTGAS